MFTKNLCTQLPRKEYSHATSFCPNMQSHYISTPLPCSLFSEQHGCSANLLWKKSRIFRGREPRLLRLPLLHRLQPPSHWKHRSLRLETKFEALNLFIGVHFVLSSSVNLNRGSPHFNHLLKWNLDEPIGRGPSYSNTRSYGWPTGTPNLQPAWPEEHRIWNDRITKRRPAKTILWSCQIKDMFTEAVLRENACKHITGEWEKCFRVEWEKRRRGEQGRR